MDKSLLTPGEKLRMLRKKYGFKQYELTGGEVSRNFISMVENGKANLTIRTAEVIARKANTILKTKNVDKIVTAYELLESVEEQIDKMAGFYLDKFNNKTISESEIEEVIKFTFKKELTDSIFLLNSKIGDYYFEKEDFLSAILFYSSFFHYNPKTQSGRKALENTLIKTLKSCYISGNFNKIVSTYQILLKYDNILSIKSKRFILEMILKSLAIQKKYKEALVFIKENFNDAHLMEDKIYNLNIQLRKGFCHLKLKNYNFASEIFEPISNLNSMEKETEQYKVIADIGLALIYSDFSENKKVDQKLEKLEKKMENNIIICDENQYYIYINLAHIYSVTGKFEKAKQKMDKYVNLVKNKKIKVNFSNYFGVFRDLVQHYNINKNDNSVKYMQNLFLENMKKLPFGKNNEIILDLVKFYCENGFIEEANKLLKI